MDLSIILIGLLGWLGGSLVNYLSDVLPFKRSLVKPFCPACGAEQTNMGYWFLPVRCQACGAQRRLRVWLVYLLGAAVAMFLWLAPDQRLPFWLNLLVGLYFGLIIVIDLEYRLILHPTSLAGAALGLGVGVWLHGWLATLLGGIAGFGFMYGMYLLGNVFGRWMAKRRNIQGEEGEAMEEALGFGDVNLAGVIGLMLGWPGVIAGLLLAIFLGGAVSLIYLVVTLLLRRYQAFIAIPYGPFLALAALFLLYFRL